VNHRSGLPASSPDTVLTDDGLLTEFKTSKGPHFSKYMDLYMMRPNLSKSGMLASYNSYQTTNFQMDPEAPDMSNPNPYGYNYAIARHAQTGINEIDLAVFPESHIANLCDMATVSRQDPQSKRLAAYATALSLGLLLQFIEHGRQEGEISQDDAETFGQLLEEFGTTIGINRIDPWKFIK
jgi:hypothetical protein